MYLVINCRAIHNVIFAWTSVKSLGSWAIWLKQLINTLVSNKTSLFYIHVPCLAVLSLLVFRKYRTENLLINIIRLVRGGWGNDKSECS